MLWHITIAVGLVFATTLIHTTCTIGVVVWVRTLSERHWAMRNALTRTTLLAALVMMMSLASYLEALLWACFYLVDGALASLEEALYFSLVTFTTLGYGDVTLGPEWRVLSAFQAANGIILFGWTTAIIIAVVQRVLLPPDARRNDP